MDCATFSFSRLGGQQKIVLKRGSCGNVRLGMTRSDLMISMTEIWNGLTDPKNKTNPVMELVFVLCFWCRGVVAPHPARFWFVCLQVQM